MEQKRQYKTKQKEVILQCMKEHAAGHITADMVRAHLAQSNVQVGLTTIYRNLEKLVQEGTIIKYSNTATGSATFQYMGNPEEHREHYHLVCLGCGHMEHLDCTVIDEFATHIQSEHQFSLDSLKTVFYGYCQKCNANGGGHAVNPV